MYTQYHKKRIVPPLRYGSLLATETKPPRKGSYSAPIGVLPTKRGKHTLREFQPKKVGFLYAMEPTFFKLAC